MKKNLQTPLSYMPQLDSLRALAALGVYAQHFLHEGNFFRSTLPLGDLGVRLFFVLSGFLITGILLNARLDIRAGVTSKGTVIRNFFVRRFLRLLPIFYIVFTLGFVFLPDIRPYGWWYYLYLQNILFLILGDFSFAGHVWTLAVEEQFYLLWPFVVLFVAQRYLLSTMLFVVTLGVVSRLLFLSFGLTHFQASMLTPSHFDTLGMGGLLAILFVTQSKNLRHYNRVLFFCLVSGFLILVGVFFAKLMNFSSSLEFVFGELGAGLLFMWVIGIAAVGFKGAIGFILESPLLIYLGKVSYGMYLYHDFIPKLFNYLSSEYNWTLPSSEWPQFILYSLTSILVAIVSWYLVEKPVLKLKRHFN